MEADRPNEALIIIEKMSAQKKKSEQAYLETMSEMRKMILAKKDRKAYEDCLRALFYMHTIDEFSSDQFADIYHHRFPVMQAASLTQQYVRRRRMKQIGNVPDRWLMYNKRAGERLAQMLGVRCLQTEYGFTLEQIPRRENIVVKPQNGTGSKGVFIVRGFDDIWSVDYAKQLHSWEEMIGLLRMDRQNGRFSSDEYEIQQAVYENNATKTPARDLKFFAFYGEIAAVEEIVRTPQKGIWWWSPDGKRIEADIGLDVPAYLKPHGFAPEMIEAACKLSLGIPAPFLRLDFLVGEDGLYFDEFCSMPGSSTIRSLEYASPRWNRIFGNMYLKAEMRIVNDLLEGKTFDEINEFNRIYDAKHKKK